LKPQDYIYLQITPQRQTAMAVVPLTAVATLAFLEDGGMKAVRHGLKNWGEPYCNNIAVLLLVLRRVITNKR
jgi:hypothetical protein